MTRGGANPQIVKKIKEALLNHANSILKSQNGSISLQDIITDKTISNKNYDSLLDHLYYHDDENIEIFLESHKLQSVYFCSKERSKCKIIALAQFLEKYEATDNNLLHFTQDHKDSFQENSSINQQPNIQYNKYNLKTSRDLTEYFKLHQDNLEELGSGSYGTAILDKKTNRVYKSNFDYDDSSRLPMFMPCELPKGKTKKDLILAATNPHRVANKWNFIYNKVLNLPEFATAQVVKVSNDNILETPFIDGDNFNQDTPGHIQAFEELKKKLDKAKYFISDITVSGNIKLINYKNKLIAVPVDLDFIINQNRGSFVSEAVIDGFAKLLQQQ